MSPNSNVQLRILLPVVMETSYIIAFMIFVKALFLWSKGGM